MIGLVLGVLEVGVWDRTSILENITWHRHGEGDMVVVVVVMEVLVVDGLDLMLKYPGTTVGLTGNIIDDVTQEIGMLKTGEKPD